MNAKPKTPPKNKAVRNAPSKKTVPAPKKKAITVQKTMAVPEKVKKPVQTRQSRAVSKVPVKKEGRKTGVRAKTKRVAVKKKAAPKRKVVKKKLRARQVRLGPIPKYHTDHKSWDKLKAMTVICERIASSSFGVAEICKRDKELPNVATVLKWLSDEYQAGGAKPLHDKYKASKDMQADYMADEIISIADDGSNDYLSDDEGNERINAEHVQRSRLRVDARKWVASKLKPKKYGDKLELSGDPERPLSALSDTELDAQIAALTKMLAEVKLA